METNEVFGNTIGNYEKWLLRKLVRMIRRWYARVSVRELSRNPELVRSIEEFERSVQPAFS